MKTSTAYLISTVLAAAGAVSTSLPVAAAGLMTPANSALANLGIKEHHVDVVIEDGYAVTTVDQVFNNPHDHALEAIYSFPIPEKAAVGEFTYWINGKAVTAEVVEKKRARQIYREEKTQGRETALAEQDGHHSFDSRVYPVQPHGEVKVRMVYIQPVHTDLGIGRYVYPLEEGAVDEHKLAFWSYDEVVEEAFSFNLEMRSSYPIDNFRLPAHPQATIVQTSPQAWAVSMENTARQGNNLEGVVSANSGPAYSLDKDIVVYWRHQPGLPGAIDMVSHREEASDRGTFMLTITPGDDLGVIEAGRDWTFVLDYSGSMQSKYHSLIEGVRKGLHKLRIGDRYRIVLFNESALELTRGFIPVTPENVRGSIRKLENIQPDGGTNLYAGLADAYRRLDADRPSAVILVSDGVANVGVTQKQRFLKLLEEHDVRLYSFAMGNSANRPLLEGMAKVSNGYAVNVSNSDDIVGHLMQAADKLSHEAYRDLKVKIRGVKVTDMTPAHIGSLYRGQQLTLFGHYWGDGPAEVNIAGKVSGETVKYQAQVSFPKRQALNPELERLWAYAAIEGLQNQTDYLGMDEDSRQAIVDIALEYGLLTDYTSMIVVNESVFETQGIARNNAARVKAEQNARGRRSDLPVRDHRQDTSKPAFNSPRAYPSSGGGAMGPLALLLLASLLLLGKRNH